MALCAPDDLSDVDVDECLVADDLAVASTARSTRSKFEALKVASKWLVDIGCGKDIVPHRDANVYRDNLEEVEPMTFGIANGSAESTVVFPIAIVDVDDLDVELGLIFCSQLPLFSPSVDDACTCGIVPFGRHPRDNV